MIAMIQQIIDVIGFIFTGIVSMIGSFVIIIGMIPQFLAFIMSLIGVAPLFITSFMVVGVTASILFFVLGRN